MEKEIIRKIFNLYVLNEYTLIGFKDFAKMFNSSEEELCIILRDFYNKHATEEEKEILRNRYKIKNNKRDKIKDAIMIQDLFYHFINKKDYNKTLQYAIKSYGKDFTRSSLKNRLIKYYEIATLEEKKSFLFTLKACGKTLFKLFANFEKEIILTQEIIKELYSLYLNGLTIKELNDFALILKLTVDELSQILVDYYFYNATIEERENINIKLKETPLKKYDLILNKIKRKKIFEYFLKTKELEKTLLFSAENFGLEYTKYSLSTFLINTYFTETEKNKELFMNAALKNEIVLKHIQKRN